MQEKSSFRAIFPNLSPFRGLGGLLLRGIVGLDGLRLNDDGGVIALDVPALVRDRPRDVATRHRDTRHNDCHNQDLSHAAYPLCD